MSSKYKIIEILLERKEFNIKTFITLTEQEKVTLLMNLINEYPCLRGSQLTRILKVKGYADIDKSILNSFLHNHSDIFNPNRENSQQAPKWATVASRNNCNKIELNFEKNLYNWQSEALKRWIENNKKGYIIASRRSGKTHLAKFIAYEHTLNLGPVVISVLSQSEVYIWIDHINELNKQYFHDVKYQELGSGHNGIIDQNSIYIGTSSSINKIESIPKYTLLIVEHIDLINLKKFNILSKNFYALLGLSNIFDDKSSNKTMINQHFGKLVFEYSVTNAMLNDEVQPFTLSFIPIKLVNNENKLYIDSLSNLKDTHSSIDEVKIDIYYELDQYNRAKDPGFIYLKKLYEFINMFQSFEEKLLILESRIFDFSGYEKIIVFCESSETIRRSQEILVKNNISFLVHSNVDNLIDISSPLKNWTEQKVLLTDHIKYIEDVDFGYIDYVLIFGTLGNSNRLTRKIETFLQPIKVNKSTKIEILYTENTIEDPFFSKDAYLDYREYIYLNGNVKSIREQKQSTANNTSRSITVSNNIVKEEFDYYSMRILVVNGKRFNDYIVDICNEIEFNNEVIDFIDIDALNVLPFIYESAISRKYSDIIVAKEINDLDTYHIEKLGEISNINIKIHNKNYLSITNLIVFIKESFKYNFGRGY